MKFNLLAVSYTVLAAATLANSQSSTWYKFLPDCAVDCAFQAAKGVGCAIEDPKCICKNIIKFEAIFEKCILSNPKCTNADIIVTEKIIRSLCFNCTTTDPGPFPTTTIRL
ncbi:hypothetical protein BJ165DRAFT_1574412 [Panaeolus papilionaceus]|nr:hypothetical protein BJ165DRAFT_1574412 [Panaeolus papilionaceus]